MSQYRELVNRQLNVRHAGMEMGLAKAREQEAFVLQLDRLLSQTSWPHEMGMSRDFDVVFNVEIGLIAFEHQFAAVSQFLSGYFDVATEGAALHVSPRHRPEISAEIRFGDVPQ
ncbi:MAG: hypothetical protein JKY60_07220 [Kordiimonadaceae bacterium]|jgi:hypothetical protein|nr:hypothetical protein [Bacillus pumilus]MBL4788836.1 hypothetical protein [Kordiimonadaceae bacterium]TKD54265.1 hypothetical protein FBF75_19585 [Bacillus sp. S2(2019)]TKI21472.1 hypothetical protein FCO27_18875 [Bacillus pumilus]